MALNGAYENKKTRRLARALQMPPWAALGMIEAVWWFVRNKAPSGHINTERWEDLAEYLWWHKPETQLREILIDAGLVERVNGRDFIRNWETHVRGR